MEAKEGEKDRGQGEMNLDWLVSHLNERERFLYRIAIIHSKDPDKTDKILYHAFVTNCKEFDKKEPEKNIKIPTIIEWNLISKEPAPDSIEVIFITKGEHWYIGTWDSDHNHYTDQNSQDIYDPVLWAYIPKIPHIFTQGIIATDEAVVALARMRCKL